MTILAGLATVSGVFLGLGSLPQAIKIFQTKNALELKSMPLVIPNVLGVILGVVILTGWHLYGRPNKKHSN